MSTKLSNPKDVIGSDKLPLHLWPASATLYGTLGLLDGMLKYGRTNWRVAGVRASIYADALQRHMSAWFEGEDQDPDSGLSHLSHALACLAILVDALEAGKLTDDRMVPASYRTTIDKLTPEVAKLKRKHAGKNPKHYTKADQKTQPLLLQPQTQEMKPILWDELRQGMEKQRELDDARLHPYTAHWTVSSGGRSLPTISTYNNDMTHEDEEGDSRYWGNDATGIW